MKNFIIGFLALPLFVTAEPFVDYDYSEQVTEMTVITVKPNLIDDYNCDNSVSPLDERERVIEEYENKLNGLTLEIYEKQTKLEELEMSLSRRLDRIELKEKKLATSGFDNVFHLSVVILVGYTATKIVSLFLN